MKVFLSTGDSGETLDVSRITINVSFIGDMPHIMVKLGSIHLVESMTNVSIDSTKDLKICVIYDTDEIPGIDKGRCYSHTVKPGNGDPSIYIGSSIYISDKFKIYKAPTMTIYIED